MSSQLMVHPLRLNLNQIPMYCHQMALENDQDRLSRNHCHQHQYTSQRHFHQELKVINHRQSQHVGLNHLPLQSRAHCLTQQQGMRNHLQELQSTSNFLSKQLRGSLILIELEARDHLPHWRQLVHLEGLLRLLMLVGISEMAFHTD